MKRARDREREGGGGGRERERERERGGRGRGRWKGASVNSIIHLQNSVLFCSCISRQRCVEAKAV